MSAPWWQDGFLLALKRTKGNVTKAAQLAGVTPRNAYLRRASNPDFAAQWDAMERAVRDDCVRRVANAQLEAS